MVSRNMKILLHHRLSSEEARKPNQNHPKLEAWENSGKNKNMNLWPTREAIEYRRR